MRKDIYSAIDADELQKYLDKGYLIKGIFGNTLKELKERTEIECLDKVYGEACINRFHTGSGSSSLFKVTGVYEWAAMEEENVLKLNGQHIRFKKDINIVSEEGSRIVKIGNVHVSAYDLLEFFENEDGSPVGELKEVSWIY